MITLTERESQMIQAYKMAVKSGLYVTNEKEENNNIDVFDSCLWYMDDDIEVKIFNDNLTVVNLDDLPDQRLYERAKIYQKLIMPLLID